jgi:hypothetical protein
MKRYPMALVVASSVKEQTMLSVRTQSKSILHALATMLLFANMAAAQIATKAIPSLAQGQANIELPVLATMDLYRAGGYDDGSNGIAPAIYSFRVRAGRVLTFSSVSGSWTCQDGYPEYSADGETSADCFTSGGPTNINPVGPFSGYQLTDFMGALAGIFLEDSLPTAAPASLRFYVSDSSQGGIQTGFPLLSPPSGRYSLWATA